jgi:hypothetical protein
LRSYCHLRKCGRDRIGAWRDRRSQRPEIAAALKALVTTGAEPGRPVRTDADGVYLLWLLASKTKSYFSFLKIFVERGQCKKKTAPNYDLLLRTKK